MLFTAVLGGLLPSCAAATARTVAIDPTNTRISYTVFVLDLLPVTATFERFHGLVVRDPARPGTCYVQVVIDVASLHMEDPDRRRQALAPDMLDAAHFPTMRYTGACTDHTIAGNLLLHGVTRKFVLAMQRDATQVSCVGTLARRDFGILGMRDLVAPDVRIRLSVRLPP